VKALLNEARLFWADRLIWLAYVLAPNDVRGLRLRLWVGHYMADSLNHEMGLGLPPGSTWDDAVAAAERKLTA